MNIYKVAIIGAGSIGALKPDHVDYPGSPNILTHAHAVFQHPQTDLYAAIDVDNERLIRTKAKWQPELTLQLFNDLETHGHKCPDIVIVAVPTELHLEIFKSICSSTSPPRLIIAEKPFGRSFVDSQEMYDLCRKRNIAVVVDYIRRFANGYQEIKKQIDSGRFGKAQNARVLYGRGLHHEGCHAVDILRYFFGECTESLVEDRAFTIPSSEKIIDRSENDPSVYAEFEFQKCPSAVFQPCDGRLYGIFEIDICFENCRIRFIDNGLYYEMYPIAEENEWGHKSLNYRLTDVVRRETGLNIALYNLIDNAVKFLDGKEQLFCTAKDAIAVHEILEE